MSALSANQQTWIEFFRKSHVPALEDATEVARIFAPEIRRYCELIQARDRAAIGFMFRGENAQFTARVQKLMRSRGITDEAIAQYLSLAEWFEHRRAFVKFEWHSSEEAKQITPLIAYYFRRRPSVKNTLDYLHSRGVCPEILQQVAQVASLLAKDSIHFVAGACQFGDSQRYKLYFSQYITTDLHATILERLIALMEWFGLTSAMQNHLIQYHPLLVPFDRATTLFASISFTRNKLIPSVKLDYPDIAPQVAAALLPPEQSMNTQAEIENFCKLVSRADLSYLGVRYHQSGEIGLKYYADRPE